MKNIMKLALIAIFGVGLSTAVLAKYEKNKELELSSQNLESFTLDTGAGDLIIRGDKNADKISVRAKIRPDDIDPDSYTLTLEQQGNEAVLVAHIESRMFNNSYIDLLVTVPSELKLEIMDRSGDLEVEDIQADVRIDDRSGDIHLKNIQGDLIVKDRSGDIEMRSMIGDVDILDRSGDLDIITLTGNLSIDDSSGDVNIRTVAGNVELEDGSGDIDIIDVSGKVGVEDGSGDINIDGAESFVLYRDGKGDVDLANVKNH